MAFQQSNSLIKLLRKQSINFIINQFLKTYNHICYHHLKKKFNHIEKIKVLLKLRMQQVYQKQRK